MTWKHSTMRIFGNAGLFFVAPYTGSTINGTPNLEIALWTMVVGMILSGSRELLENAKNK